MKSRKSLLVLIALLLAPAASRAVQVCGGINGCQDARSDARPSAFYPANTLLDIFDKAPKVESLAQVSGRWLLVASCSPGCGDDNDGEVFKDGKSILDIRPIPDVGGEGYEVQATGADYFDLNGCYRRYSCDQTTPQPISHNAGLGTAVVQGVECKVPKGFPDALVCRSFDGEYEIYAGFKRMEPLKN